MMPTPPSPPVAPPPATRASSEAAVATAARSILLVEDDDDIREIVAEVLSARGYGLLLAENGRQALELLKRAGQALPRLILLDMMMPDMDGREFLAEQRREAALAEIPVVVLTASGRARQHPDLDVAAWLSKPIELEVLLASVTRFCGPPEQRRGRADSPSLEERIPEFLERRRRELPVLLAALEAGDHVEARLIGHNLKGAASGFGFPAMGVLGARLEAAAMADDVAAMRAVAEELRALVTAELAAHGVHAP